MAQESFLVNRRIKFVLNCVMSDLGAIALSMVSKMNLPDEKAKAAAYVMVITNLVETVSESMKELNRLGIEKVRGEYSIKEPSPTPKSIIV